MAPRTCAVCGCDISHRWRSTLYCSNKCTDEAAIARGTKTRGRKKREAAEVRITELENEIRQLRRTDDMYQQDYSALVAKNAALREVLEDAAEKLRLYRHTYGGAYVGGVEYVVLEKRITAALTTSPDMVDQKGTEI